MREREREKERERERENAFLNFFGIEPIRPTSITSWHLKLVKRDQPRGSVIGE